MTNAYQRRLSHRLARKRETYTAQRLDNFIRIDRFMLSFENAWTALYNEKVQVQYHNGWYWILGRRLRHSALERLTEIMQAELHELQMGINYADE